MNQSLTKQKCKPCESMCSQLSSEEENKLIKQVPSWKLGMKHVNKIIKEYEFKDFKEAMAFLNKVAVLAEEGHHPDIFISYNFVSIELYTHSIQGLSQNDFILAAKIDKL
ncbi:MAG: 4a-hydroxytetrahydrobiopterin dehydratase [Candidatus Aenigmatarchaeota archaeon]